jgi:hypothetical protein
MEKRLRDIIQEPPLYAKDSYTESGAFPSLIDLAYEAVHMGADEQAKRLLDLRKFLIDYFKEVDGLKYAESMSNEEAYKHRRPRTLG